MKYRRTRLVHDPDSLPPEVRTQIQEISTKVDVSTGHVPVLMREVLEAFAPLRERSPLRYFDGTLGRGGHLEAVMSLFPECTGLGVDRDPEALAAVSGRLGAWISSHRLELKSANFHDFDLDAWGAFDLALLDLGVSSPQLDQPGRGFSFYTDGPLDMRMNPTQGPTAADFVNSMSDAELYRVFKEDGEIFKPGRVVNEIIKVRANKPFETTLELAKLIERIEGWRKKGFHPATPYFMALRILVNNELSGLEENLTRLLSGLRPGGRLVVLTFHSLEDRIVKNIFRNSPRLGQPVNKKVIQPTREEEVQNPRARSAKLRIFEATPVEEDVIQEE